MLNGFCLPLLASYSFLLLLLAPSLLCCGSCSPFEGVPAPAWLIHTLQSCQRYLLGHKVPPSKTASPAVSPPVLPSMCCLCFLLLHFFSRVSSCAPGCVTTLPWNFQTKRLSLPEARINPQLLFTAVPGNGLQQDSFLLKYRIIL